MKMILVTLEFVEDKLSLPFVRPDFAVLRSFRFKWPGLGRKIVKYSELLVIVRQTATLKPVILLAL